MIGELWVLAVALGLVVSAAVYLIFIWPRREPAEQDSELGDAGADRANAGASAATDASPSGVVVARGEPAGDRSQRALTVDLAQQIPLRVLLADDTAMNQKLIRHVFARMGYDIEVVDNGVAAVESARASEYDLILMDIQMPEMDGIEACVHILAEARSRGVRPPAIVAVTANASDDNRRRCLAAGMCDFIPKPFTLERLQQVVSSMGDGSETYRAPTSS